MVFAGQSAIEVHIGLYHKIYLAKGSLRGREVSQAWSPSLFVPRHLMRPRAQALETANMA